MTKRYSGQYCPDESIDTKLDRIDNSLDPDTGKRSDWYAVVLRS